MVENLDFDKQNIIKDVLYNKIQLDLNNNALIFLEKSDQLKNLQLLEAQLKRSLSNKNINKILFLYPQKKPFKNEKFSELRQKTILNFIQVKSEVQYDKKLLNLSTFDDLRNEPVQISLFYNRVPDKIDTLQYRGNKNKIINFLKPHFNKGKNVLDLMAGSQSLSLALKSQSRIISNDVQYYSYVLGKAYIENNIYTRLKTIPREFIKPNPKYKLFQNFFVDVYFTKEQCIEIDNIRAFIDEIKNIDIFLYYCYLACLLQSLDMIARTAGHFDGALSDNTKKAKIREKKSVFDELYKRIKTFRTVKSQFKNKCYNKPALVLLNKIPEVDIIYIDPPYNHRQYSRYYHILETCAKYDANIKQNTKGLYRNDEFKSDFCYKDTVEQAFRRTLKLSIEKAKSKVLLSYTNVGLLAYEKILRICNELSPNVRLYEKDIKYTRQKTSKIKRIEKELLFVLKV